MKWFGLTGGIACGKSAVANLLTLRNYPVIDADQMAKLAVAPGTPGFAEVIKTFPEVESGDGNIDRQALAALVFKNKERLHKLESIIHPWVRKLTELRRRKLASDGFLAAFYDVPLLFEGNLQSAFDKVIVVACEPKVQLARLMKRNQLTEDQAQARIAAQIPLSEKKAKADFVITNDGSFAELEPQVDRLLSFLNLPKVGPKSIKT